MFLKKSNMKRSGFGKIIKGMLVRGYDFIEPGLFMLCKIEHNIGNWIFKNSLQGGENIFFIAQK